MLLSSFYCVPCSVYLIEEWWWCIILRIWSFILYCVATVTFRKKSNVFSCWKNDGFVSQRFVRKHTQREENTLVILHSVLRAGEPVQGHRHCHGDSMFFFKFFFRLLVAFLLPPPHMPLPLIYEIRQVTYDRTPYKYRSLTACCCLAILWDACESVTTSMIVWRRRLLANCCIWLVCLEWWISLASTAAFHVELQFCED